MHSLRIYLEGSFDRLPRMRVRARQLILSATPAEAGPKRGYDLLMAGRRNNPSRIVKLTAIYLFAGAITTIAVAWSTIWIVGYAMPDPIVSDFRGNKTARDEGFDREGSLIFNIWRQPGASMIQMVANSVVLYRPKSREADALIPLLPMECRAFSRHWIQNDARMIDSRSIDLRGWPMHALWCAPEETVEAVKHEARFGIALESMPVTTGWQPRLATLPLAPLWTGFAIDTLLYAAMWFLPIFSFVRIKRFIRRRRGRCVMCGYQLKDISAGCSECGHGRDSEPSEPGRSRPD